MAGIQDLPSLPLRRVLDFLDQKSRRNFLDATEGTELGLKMKSMARQRRFVCPECIIKHGGENMAQIMKQQEHMPIALAHKMIGIFDFFVGFRFSPSGNKNYRHKVVNVDHKTEPTMSILEPREHYIERVRYSGYGTEDYFDKDWLNVTERIREKTHIYKTEFERTILAYFGGTIDGVTVESNLKIYNRQEFEEHICNDHNIDEDLNIQEFWVWADKHASRHTPEYIPRAYYLNNNIEIDMLEYVVMKIVIARYYKHKKTGNTTIAEALGTEKEHILWEARKIFYFACMAFKKIQFPIQEQSVNEKNLYKFYEMNLRTIDALLMGKQSEICS